MIQKKIKDSQNSYPVMTVPLSSHALTDFILQQGAPIIFSTQTLQMLV